MQPLFIVGAGGIGCAVGYALGAAGVPVTFVDADAAKVRWSHSHGVQVDQRPPVLAPIEHFDAWSPPPDATVLLCTKCYDNAAVLARLPDSVTLLPIQNGFDRKLDARGNDWEGIASFVSECVPHTTRTRLTRRGKLHLGPRHPVTPSPRHPVTLPWAAALRDAPFRLVTVPDILPYKYTKLMYNAAISPVAAAAGIDNGQLLSLPTARRLFFALLAENDAILRHAGKTLGKVGPFHPNLVRRILRRRGLARLLAWTFTPSLRGTYCSMAGDLPRGRTEIDYYNGHLIELAGEEPCPWNRLVVELVKRMERERTAPSPAALNALLAA